MANSTPLQVEFEHSSTAQSLRLAESDSHPSWFNLDPGTALLLVYMFLKLAKSLPLLVTESHIIGPEVEGSF